MTLFELLESVRWPDTKAFLLWSYPDVAGFLDDYRLVLAKLRKSVPIESNMRIILNETNREGLDDEPFIEVVGRNGQLNRDQCDFKYFQDAVDTEYANSETDFSLSLVPWEQWLGMQIDIGTLDKFSAPQIVAYCLWDMTFHGFEQWQVQETMDEIKRRVDEIDAMTEEERKEKLIPMEEVMRKLESAEKKQ